MKMKEEMQRRKQYSTQFAGASSLKVSEGFYYGSSLCTLPVIFPLFSLFLSFVFIFVAHNLYNCDECTFSDFFL